MTKIYNFYDTKTKGYLGDWSEDDGLVIGHLMEYLRTLEMATEKPTMGHKVELHELDLFDIDGSKSPLSFAESIAIYEYKKIVKSGLEYTGYY